MQDKQLYFTSLQVAKAIRLKCGCYNRVSLNSFQRVTHQDEVQLIYEEVSHLQWLSLKGLELLDSSSS